MGACPPLFGLWFGFLSLPSLWSHFWGLFVERRFGTLLWGSGQIVWSGLFGELERTAFWFCQSTIFDCLILDSFWTSFIRLRSPSDW